MEKLNLKKYINHPDAMNKDSLNDLFELSKEFPYFQTAWILLAKNLHVIDDHRFDELVKKAATYANDRSRFQQIIMESEPKADVVHDKLKHVNPIKTDSNQPLVANDKPAKETSEKQEIIVETEKYPSENISPPEKEQANNKAEVEQEKPIEQEKPEVQINVSNAIEPKVEVEHSDEDLGSLLHARLKELKKSSKQISENELEPVKKAKPQEEKLENESENQNNSEDYIISDEDLFSFSEEKPDVKLPTKNLKRSTLEKAFDTLDNKDKLEPENHQQKLLDQFISMSSDVKPNFSESSTKTDYDSAKFNETSELVTETLAKIYLSQGHLEKAMIIYERLSLKYPQKNIYFANHITKIKELIRTKDK